MKTKKFDCVEMKRKSADVVYGQVANLTKAEQLQFWRTGNDELRRLMDALKRKNKKAA